MIYYVPHEDVFLIFATQGEREFRREFGQGNRREYIINWKEKATSIIDKYANLEYCGSIPNDSKGVEFLRWHDIKRLNEARKPTM